MLAEPDVPLWHPIGCTGNYFLSNYESKPGYEPVVHTSIVSCFAASSAQLPISSTACDFKCYCLQPLGFLGAPLFLWENCQVTQGDPKCTGINGSYLSADGQRGEGVR